MRNNVQICHPLVKTLRTRMFTASLGHNTKTKKFTVIQLVLKLVASDQYTTEILSN